MLNRAADMCALFLHSGAILESCHIQTPSSCWKNPREEWGPTQTPRVKIITLIKILRIKRSLIKDPVKLWRCQFSGLALLLCRWWVAKQNQRSLNYKDESQSQKGMREAVLCDGDGPAPISSKLSSPLHGESHNASKLNILSTSLTIPRTELIAMPIYLTHWIKLNPHDLVTYVNF